MSRPRSLSITPTYSTDRATLLQRKPAAIASTVEEAIAELGTLNICNDSTFKRRANLESKEEWTAFLESCACSDGDESATNPINLEAALKKCYALAYSMPPSPIMKNRSISPTSTCRGEDPPAPLSL